MACGLCTVTRKIFAAEIVREFHREMAIPSGTPLVRLIEQKKHCPKIRAPVVESVAVEASESSRGWVAYELRAIRRAGVYGKVVCQFHREMAIPFGALLTRLAGQKNALIYGTSTCRVVGSVTLVALEASHGGHANDIRLTVK